MAHRRTAVAESLPQGEALTGACVGIGMLFAASPVRDANIEDTLVAASIEGMEHDDLRMLSLLVTWLSIHAERINADRLIRAVRARASARVSAFWSAFAEWHAADARFAKLVVRGERVELLRVGSAFQVKRRGEDARFADTRLVVPEGVLRDRAQDVLTPEALSRKHAAYRWRLIIGPTYRADMWAALERNPRLSAAELARAAYGSFATAWKVRRDFTLVRG